MPEADELVAVRAQRGWESLTGVVLEEFCTGGDWAVEAHLLWDAMLMLSLQISAPVICVLVKIPR